jgi:4-methyl-5(b-hydroxyethyl)-thiazole monophosphate biosynthesis
MNCDSRSEFLNLKNSNQSNTTTMQKVIRRSYLTIKSQSKRVLVPIANGSEELEAIAIINTLRRANFNVTVAKVFSQNNEAFPNDLQIKASRGCLLTAETDLESIHTENFDAIALPGGLEGAKTLGTSDTLVNMLKKQKEDPEKWMAAICASPVYVFAQNELLKHVRYATCYPSLQPEFDKLDKECHYLNEPVVRYHNVITSQGPATAIPFALELIHLLKDRSTADEVAKALLVQYHPIVDRATAYITHT